MKIRINKIFGKYTHEVDLNKKCNVLIGENGIGKSTVMKIINHILKHEYIELLNYYFESIDLICGKNKVTINYLDIALDSEYVINSFIRKNISFKDEITNFYLHLDSRLLYKILKFDMDILATEEVIRYIDGSEIYISIIKEIYAEAKVEYEYAKYYYDSKLREKIEKINNILNKFLNIDVLYIDMTTKFDVINDKERKYAFNDYETALIDDKYKEVLEENLKTSDLLSYVIDTRSLSDRYSGYMDVNLVDEVKSRYYMQNVKKEDTFDGCKLDFGYLLFSQIYTKELQDEFREDLYNYIKNNIKNISPKSDWNMLANNTFNKLKLYIKPLITENSIFKFILNYKINDKYFTYDDEAKLLVGFAKKYEDKYININNDKLIKLNKLFAKYFKNKQVVATPFGISISTKDLNNDILFEELSAGEKKIIILFCLTVFTDNLIILLDEPEISLSIVWQEKLLPDLLKNVNLTKLLVATQSPYIIESEKLDNYIVGLTDGDYNGK